MIEINQRRKDQRLRVGLYDAIVQVRVDFKMQRLMTMGAFGFDGNGQRLAA